MPSWSANRSAALFPIAPSQVRLRGSETLTASARGSSKLRHPPVDGGAKSGAPAESSPPYPDLQAVIEAWPSLPDEARRLILMIVHAGDRTSATPPPAPENSD